MGKKGRRGGQQQKRGQTISLFEFNEDVTVGKDPELAELPSAPKLAEEWAALGGRPEYNHRGYKERERRTDPYSDGRTEDDFDNRDWTRRGPVDGANDESGFGTGPERDWGSARRAGPLDDGTAAGGTTERNVDFGSVRRGPVEAEFSGKDVDFGVRRGPIEAEFGNAGRDVDFGVRKGPVEAEFAGGRDVDFGVRKGPVEAEFAGGRDVDFGVRKGPVEAEFAGARDVDFGGARKGPVEAEFAGGREVDFGGARKGPIEAEFSGTKQVDFGGARKGPIEAEFVEKKERDFSFRKGPLDSEVKTSPARNIDFANMRRTPVQDKSSAAATPPQRRNFANARRGSENNSVTPTRDFGNMRRRGSVNPNENLPRREFGRRASETSTNSTTTSSRADEDVRGSSANAWARRDGDWRGVDRSTTSTTTTTTTPQRQARAVAKETDSEWTTVRTTMKRVQPVQVAERKV